MLFEYIRLPGMGDSFFLFNFASQVLLLVLSGIILALVGFRIKGVWGTALFLAAGAVFLLYHQGMIRF